MYQGASTSMWYEATDTRNTYVRIVLLDFSKVPNILICGKVVERVDHVKLLGITLSNDLTWKRHVDNIVKKAGKRIDMLYQLKRAGVNQADLVTIYI